MFQGDSCWRMGKTSLGKVPEAASERKIFKPPISYSGCLLRREVGCALTGNKCLPGVDLVCCLSPMSERGRRSRGSPRRLQSAQYGGWVRQTDLSAGGLGRGQVTAVAAQQR